MYVCVCSSWEVRFFVKWTICLQFMFCLHLGVSCVNCLGINHQIMFPLAGTQKRLYFCNGLSGLWTSLVLY